MKQRLTTLVLSALVVAATLPLAPTPATAAEATSVTLTCFPHGRAPVEFVNSWGAPRSGGRGHTGVDLMTPRGFEVIAAADGYVETMRNGNRSGYYVRLSHDEGTWETWYMHLNNDTPGTDDGRGGAGAAYAPGLEVGDFVRAGDVIGYVGDSGNAEWTSPHTHFELHIGDRKVNPYDFLVEAEQRLVDTYSILDVTQQSAEVGPGTIDDGALWGWLIESGADRCVNNSYKEVIEHLFGQLPSESVLLARVEAR